MSKSFREPGSHGFKKREGQGEERRRMESRAGLSPVTLVGM